MKTMLGAANAHLGTGADAQVAASRRLRTAYHVWLLACAGAMVAPDSFFKVGFLLLACVVAVVILGVCTSSPTLGLRAYAKAHVAMGLSLVGLAAPAILVGESFLMLLPVLAMLVLVTCLIGWNKSPERRRLKTWTEWSLTLGFIIPVLLIPVFWLGIAWFMIGLRTLWRSYAQFQG